MAGKYPREENKSWGSAYRKARVIIDYSDGDSNYWVRQLNGKWYVPPFRSWEEALEFANKIVVDDRNLHSGSCNVD